MITADQIAVATSQLRNAYDRPDANVERAHLRRAGSLEDVLATPAFWALLRKAGLADELTSGESHEARRTRRLLAILAFSFSAAPARTGGREPLGLHLRRTLVQGEVSEADLSKGTPRLRRLLG